MLQPNRTKYRKDQKGRNPGLATRGANVAFGDFGLKALERGRITARQIEAARRLPATLSVVVVYGSASSRTSPFPPSPLKFVWATVRAILNTGSPRFSRVVCSMKWTAWMSPWLVKPLPWRLPSCR